ncbi:MAG: InlB B-repeat-containing protein, partial [Clostridia bacterium]|nr:InlB B-repeat-containing protein [Clostridia bacterium]
CFCFSGCYLFNREPAFDYQDFVCCYVRDAESFYGTSKEKATGVNVLTFIEKDKEWDRVVIPNFIDGLPVIAVGHQSNGFSWTSLVGRGYYKKIYIPSSLQNCTPADMFENKTVFLLDTQGDEYMENRKTLINKRLNSTTHSNFVVFESKYEWYQEFFSVHESSLLVVANVTYIVDGVEYWMDYCKNGEYLLSPPEPIKDGCVFDGWYTDETYLNRWDFENNQYNKPEDKITLKLYAKFLIAE